MRWRKKEPATAVSQRQVIPPKITLAEDTTLTSESVRTLWERFNDRMSQIERMQAKLDRKVLLMFEQLLKQQGSTATAVPDSTPETSSELATV